MNINLDTLLKNAGKTDVDSAHKYLLEELKSLQQNGDLELGPDKNLSGLSLELRVKQLFKEKGFNIIDGRSGQEDFVVISDTNTEHTDNLVIEVKSSRNPTSKLDDLRQLDDWAFDLSGEENARKNGLGGGMNIIHGNSFGSSIGYTTATRHPTPHKGILIFNGPVFTPFEERSQSILHPNQILFIEKRNFCVISINNLVALMRSSKTEIWSTLHMTIGEYINA